MRDADRSTKLWLVAGIIMVLALLAITVLPNIQFGPAATPKLTIKNWETTLPQVPENSRTRIEERLYSQVVMNLTENVPTSGGEIRDGSTTEVDVRDNFTVGDFIVDIPSIEQSYIIQYFYGELDGEQETEMAASVRTYCITDENNMIYDSFACKDDYGARDSEKFIQNFYFGYVLPHTEVLPNSKNAVVTMEYMDGGAIRLNISVENCGEPEVIDAAKSATKKWIEGLGLKSDNFMYYVPLKYNGCKAE